MGRLLTGFLKQLLKGDAQTGELPLERARAQPQSARHILERWSSASEQALDGGFDLVDHIAPRLRLRQLRVHLRGDQGQEFRIVRDERAAEIAGSEDQRVAR